MSIMSFTKESRQSPDLLIVIHFSDPDGKVPLLEDQKTSDALESHIKTKEPLFKGKIGQSLFFSSSSFAEGRLLVLGGGKKSELTTEKIEEIGGHAARFLKTNGGAHIHLLARGNRLSPEESAHFLCGLKLGLYKFERYKTKKEDKEGNTPVYDGPDNVTVLIDFPQEAEAAYTPLAASCEGVCFARDLVNMPPNKLTPYEFADIVRETLKPAGVKVQIYDSGKLEKLGFHAHLEVGKGSVNPPAAVILEYEGRGAKRGNKPLAFVGKGITFDTGGINLKPADMMGHMKCDMAGAAAVAGAFLSLAKRKAPVHAVGILGLAENMPSGHAYRISDVIDSLSGQTIEVKHTDAEGRLVMADSLTYIQNRFDPAMVIDMATLTGAIMVALGYEYAGSFTTNEALWQALSDASEQSHDALWRMPINERFRKEIDSPIADMQSLGAISRFGGSSTAAAFLERFIDEGRPWAHIDIAGTAWIDQDRPTAPKHATGFGVRLLDALTETFKGSDA